MVAISARQPSNIEIVYKGRGGKEVTKKFKDAIAARSFYAQKDKDGCSPVVKGPRAEEFAATLAAESKPAAEAPEVVAPAEPAKQPRPKLGVNPKAKTRAGAAGRVLAAHGLEHGVTDEMIAECGKLYGKPNLVEDGIVMRNGFHVVKAYLDAIEV